MKEEKQIFTRREIEIDLKNVYKQHILELALIILSSCISVSIAYFSVDLSKLKDSNISVILVWVMFLIVLLINVVYLCRLFYYSFKCFKCINYEIVLGVYKCHYPKHQGIIRTPHFSFEFYGDYPVDIQVIKYKWLKDTVITGDTILKMINPGDEFYLIMVNNKIAYIYSKRMFEFKETT